MALTVLALGSNVGDRLLHLRQAARALAPLLADTRCSAVYESRAVLPDGAPAEWDLAYYNMAVAGECALAPGALLAAVKELEQALGRNKRGHWGPREIDIDIVAQGDVVMQSETLRLPHARLTERDFVLYPVADVAPEWKYPVEGAFFGMRPGDIIKMQAFELGAALQRTKHEVKA